MVADHTLPECSTNIGKCRKIGKWRAELFLKFDDDRSVVRRFVLASWFLIDLAALQPLREPRTQQEVIDSDSAIVFKSSTEIIPEGELACLAGMQRPERVRVAKRKQRTVTCTGLGLKQRVIDPG